MVYWFNKNQGNGFVYSSDFKSKLHLITHFYSSNSPDSLSAVQLGLTNLVFKQALLLPKTWKILPNWSSPKILVLHLFPNFPAKHRIFISLDSYSSLSPNLHNFVCPACHGHCLLLAAIACYWMAITFKPECWRHLWHWSKR